jgi:hypothetical protein
MTREADGRSPGKYGAGGCVAKNAGGMINSALLRGEQRSSHHEQCESIQVASFPGSDHSLVRSLVSAIQFELSGPGGNDDGARAPS